MAKKKNKDKEQEYMQKVNSVMQGTQHDKLINNENFPQQEAEIFPWQRKNLGTKSSRQTNIIDRLYALSRPDSKEPVPNKTGGSGTRSGGSANPNVDNSSDIATSEPDIQSALFADADLASYQKTYDYLKNSEEKKRFEFDDTYGPDSEGFRDAGGYLMDASKVALGAFGASKPLESYKPSSEFNQMVSESTQRRDLGMSPEARSMHTDASDRIYNYDVKNIRNMSGGSGGAALANLGGASDRYYGAQNQMAALDEQIKLENRGQFYNSAINAENVHRQQFQDQREIDIANKQAAGGLMADAMDNIVQRKEYEDTYGDPDSPYYQYMKELTLDRRMNRELKQFSEDQRVIEGDKFLLDMENQYQEKINGQNVAKENVRNDFKQYAQDNGMSTPIESAEDFKNWSGDPVVDIDKPLNEQDIFNNIRTQEDFGLNYDQMSGMSDNELSELGIDRTEQITNVKNADGTTREVKSYNYGISIG